VNKRLWDKVGEKTYNSEKEYLDNLCENELSCPICQELVQKPCTTPCGHNICNACLCLSLKKYGEFCPMCRSEIASMGTVEEVREQLNHNLVTVLRALIPSYGQDWLTPVKVTEKQRAVRMGMPIDVLE
ncbi:ubiquitin-like with PHD and RING finger domains 2, partial [Coemansia sp. RSA 486]